MTSNPHWTRFAALATSDNVPDFTYDEGRHLLTFKNAAGEVEAIDCAEAGIPDDAACNIADGTFQGDSADEIAAYVFDGFEGEDVEGGLWSDRDPDFESVPIDVYLTGMPQSSNRLKVICAAMGIDEEKLEAIHDEADRLFRQRVKEDREQVAKKPARRPSGLSADRQREASIVAASKAKPSTDPLDERPAAPRP